MYMRSYRYIGVQWIYIYIYMYGHTLYTNLCILTI